jgi:hypothetical protein
VVVWSLLQTTVAIVLATPGPVAIELTVADVPFDLSQATVTVHSFLLASTIV